MLVDTRQSVKSGVIKGLKPDTSVLCVVNFVERQLIIFADKYSDSKIKNEKGLTQKLVMILNHNVSKEECPFWFDKEYMENPERGDSPQVDIGTISKAEEGIVIESKTYTNNESFFSMEAKRLDKLGAKRSKEYLLGRFETKKDGKKKYVSCGGVERFKQGIHGRNLKYGAIIGYVQEHDSLHWYDLINSWVNDLIKKKFHSLVNWTKKDQLKKTYIKPVTAKFVSVNSRQNDSITLFHLWVRLNSFKTHDK
ncbi:hypothetical protein QUF76_02035 [Desulfobacterales bacterium HSG16]|nr:hypothetical protein [Desulfobacterales bacterium HSG16]